MTKSIMQDREDMECFFCGSTDKLMEHHCIFGRGRRDLSEHYGLKVLLCYGCHENSPTGVHHNHKLDLRLKKLAQLEFCERYPLLDFASIFNRNYLDPGDTRNKIKGDK